MIRRVAAAAACLLSLLSPTILAQTAAGGFAPDRGEIESVKSSNLVFVNYEGPQSRIDSLAEIKSLGAELGREMAAVGAARRSGAAARYQVIRAIDPSVKAGLDADILVLGPDAQVDHVRNLRWIIAGYLVSAWGYAEKDGYTLATFITVYNAVHRGDLKYFASKYKSVVQKELKAETAGLALSYTEWPGKSWIVIPLSEGAAAGKLGAVDTSTVSDKAVAESLKSQSDKGVADRQALVDVKEREAAQHQAELDKQKAELAQAEKKLGEDRAKAEADRAALEAEKAAAAAAPGAATSNGGTPPTAAADKGAPAAGSAAATAELSTKEAAVKAEEAAVAAGAADLAAKKDEAAKGDAAVAAKKEEAATDRKDITADQKAVIAAEVAAKGAGAGGAAGLYLIRVGDDANHLGQIVFVDADKGNAIRSSRINSLHLRSLAELADAFFAVSGLEGKAGGVKLVKLDKTSLESVAESAAEMFPESTVLVSGASIYAIVKAADGTYYPARFAAADLAEQARAKDAVTPYTLLREASGGILVQAPGASFALLKTETLEKAKELKP
jgi:Borrelia P83/100 protein